MTDPERMVVDLLVTALTNLPEAARLAVLRHFCRACGDPIDRPDWSGRNYCSGCSPDPGD